MSTKAAALRDNPIGMRECSTMRRTAAERVGLVLTVLGMIAASVLYVSYQEARTEYTNELVPAGPIGRSTLYYITHATQISLLFSAGLVALLSLDRRTIERGYFTRFALFIGAALLMTARGYSLSDLLSTKVADLTGPLPLCVSVLVFVGAQPRNWMVLGRVMVVLAVLLSALALSGLAFLQTFTRAEGVANLAGFLNALYWLASWIALKEYPRNSSARHLRFVPMLIYALGSLFTQTRLNFVMVFAFLVVYSYVQHKRRVPQGATWIVGLTLAVWLSLFTAMFLRDTRPFERTEAVADELYSRLDADTRTGQLQSFFNDVKPSELILGRGSSATWYWGYGPWGGTDVGYLNLLFYGGLPLLITYFVVHVRPCFHVLGTEPADSRLAAAGVVLLWSIRMFSSTYPGLSLEAYPVLFCVGACISREPIRGAS